jgi:hypothetical protein
MDMDVAKSTMKETVLGVKSGKGIRLCLSVYNGLKTDLSRSWTVDGKKYAGCDSTVS